MKSTIVMNELVISMDSISMEDIKKIERFNPSALKLNDEVTNEVVFVVTATPGRHSASQYGIAFGDNNNEGKATVRVPLYGETIEEKKEYAADKYGVCISMMKALEVDMNEVIKDIEEDLAAIREDITVTV